MQADSLYYRLDATVLHSDSAKAIELAKESAVAYLLTQLDEQNEQQRLQLVNDEGLNALSSAPFILQLRRFTSYKDDIEVAQSMAQSRGDIYQGYVRVRLSKTSYRSQLRTFLDRATTNSNRDAWMDLISE
jgi:polysaccharide pyruvyl transferase WcaK-like protein